MNSPKKLADAVRSRRNALGIWTAKELAEKAGLSERIVNEIENARRDSYSDRTLFALDEALKYTPGTFARIFDGQGELPLFRHGLNDVDEEEVYSAEGIEVAVGARHISMETTVWIEDIQLDAIPAPELLMAAYTARKAFQTELDSIVESHLRRLQRNKAAHGLDTSNRPTPPVPASDDAYNLARRIATNPDAYDLAAKHHETDPLDGLGEENQDTTE